MRVSFGKLIFGGVLLSGQVGAASMVLDHKTERKAVRLTLATEYVSLNYKESATTATSTGSTIQISGPAVGVGFLYGLNSKIAFTGAARQAFSKQSGFSSMFTELSVGLAYAITGVFIRDFQETRLGGKLVSSSRDYISGGLRGSLVANQYFLNSSNNVVGLSGVGASLAWEFPSEREWSWYVGARADIASNGTISIHPMQGFVGISLWL